MSYFCAVSPEGPRCCVLQRSLMGTKGLCSQPTVLLGDGGTCRSPWEKATSLRHDLCRGEGDGTLVPSYSSFLLHEMSCLTEPLSPCATSLQAPEQHSQGIRVWNLQREEKNKFFLHRRGWLAPCSVWKLVNLNHKDIKPDTLELNFLNYGSQLHRELHDWLYVCVWGGGGSPETWLQPNAHFHTMNTLLPTHQETLPEAAQLWFKITICYARQCLPCTQKVSTV